MEKQDPIFPKGILFKKPRDGAPDFIRGHLSFKVDEAIEFLKANEKNGWVNIDIKKSREGKTYLQLDTWAPKKAEVAEAPHESIPF